MEENSRILIDAREFVKERVTGIGRVLIGLIEVLAESDSISEIILAVTSAKVVPQKFQNKQKIKICIIPISFIRSELFLSDLTKNNVELFISPYPKPLPTSS